MKNLSFVILLFIYPLLQEAQNIPALDPNNDARVSYDEWRNYDVGYSGVKGSHLLFDEWPKGTAVLKDGSEVEGVFLNYDLLRNVLLMKKSSAEAILSLPPEKVQKFGIKNGEQWEEWHNLPSSAFETEPEGSYLYGLVITENQQFIKRVSKRFVKADYKGPLSTGETYDEFVASTDYFLKNEQGKYVQVKLNQKSILGVLGGRKDKKVVKKYIRDKELWVRDEGAAVALIGFLLGE